MTTYMFPGQGSQIKGMGKGLFENHPKETSQANTILGYSIESLCLENIKNNLSKTQYTQPALFTVEALSYLDKKNNMDKANYFIGHSLGEYSALFAAGAFDFETGLKLVKKRGELMSQAQGGGMLAVINLGIDRIQNILLQNELTSIDIGNYNSPNQIVLSGLIHDIQKAYEILSSVAQLCIPLQVSGAFHSRYMQPFVDDFKNYLSNFEFNKLNTSVISNANVSEYNNQSIIDNLVKQLTNPVRWFETITYLKKNNETIFTEIGPGSVLTRLLTQN